MAEINGERIILNTVAIQLNGMRYFISIHKLFYFDS